MAVAVLLAAVMSTACSPSGDQSSSDPEPDGGGTPTELDSMAPPGGGQASGVPGRGDRGGDSRSGASETDGPVVGGATSGGSAATSPADRSFLSGTFTYTQVSSLDNPDSPSEPFQAGSEWSIVAEPRAGDRQMITYYQGKEKNQSVIEQWRWFADRREVLTRGGAGHENCEWKPPLVDLRLPIKAGASWSETSTCITDRANNGKATAKYSFRVGSPRRKSVPSHGEQQIWPVHSVTDTDFTSDGFSARLVVTVDVQYLPGLVIPLRHVEKQVVYRTGERTTTQTYTRDLNSSGSQGDGSRR